VQCPIQYSIRVTVLNAKLRNFTMLWNVHMANHSGTSVPLYIWCLQYYVVSLHPTKGKKNQPRQQLYASLQYMYANAYLQRTGTQMFMCAESYAGLKWWSTFRFLHHVIVNVPIL
jgi:hypothetical protein